MRDPLYILNFHGLGEAPPWVPAEEHPYWLSPNFFTRVLDLVRGRQDVEITFDDGNQSDFTLALPALKQRGLSARFFVVADRIGEPGYLSVAEIRALVSAGMTIGNHGFQHHRWTCINTPNLVREVTAAREQLARAAGTEVQDAACPFGSYNRRVLKALRRCKCRRVYTSDCGPANRSSCLQPRNTITRDADLAEIQRIIARPPVGTQKLWRELKLLIKRWR